MAPRQGEPQGRVSSVPQARARPQKLNWDFLITFRLPQEHQPSAERWLNLSALIATAGQALSEAEQTLTLLVAWWDEKLANLGGDPSRVDWATFRPLRLSREEDWSDWLAHLLQTSTTGTFAPALFGERLAGVVEEFAGPEVSRKQWTQVMDRRADLVIRWRKSAVSQNPLFPQLLQFSDVALLCLRLMVALVFFWSGLQHARDPIGRAASIGLSPGVTPVLGFVEMAASLGVALGVFTQVAALGLMAERRTSPAARMAPNEGSTERS